MSDPQQLFRSDQGWTDLFMLTCFLMATVCLYGGVRKALAEPERRTQAVLKELLVFGFFVFMFWSLESYAHYRTPYYAYSRSFHDLVPQASYFVPWIQDLPRLCDQCTQHVADYVHKHGGKIPLSVILLEASLTYAALWTAKLLKGPVGAQPIFAGLVLVTVDALLDPIVAMGHRCGKIMSAEPWPATGNGLGLWHWYTPEASDLIYQVKTRGLHGGEQIEMLSGQHTLAGYFHIPVFNYAAWLGAPIILVAIVNLIGALRREYAWPWSKYWYAKLRGQPVSDRPSFRHRQALLLSIVAPIMFIVYAAPAKDLSVPCQVTAIVGALAIVVGIFVWNFGKFHTVERVDATLVLPVALALAIPAIAGLVSGQFTVQPLLMPVAVVALAVGFWLAWLPYRDALHRVSYLVGQADRFTRIHYFGFTTLLMLLGASYFTNEPSNRTLLGLLIVAACFHVFAYVSNDVFDLDLDRKNPMRQKGPLVTGAISVPTALALALTAVPLSVLVTLLLADFKVGASLRCVGVLLAAYGLMTVYNWKGKRLRVPLLTDVAQGLSWGLLAIFGGMVGASTTMPDYSFGVVLGRCWLLGVYGALYIFLINGIHGGLRDLPTDLANGRRTTAILFGGSVDESDPARSGVTSTPAIQLFAHSVHLAMFGLVGYFLWLQSQPGGALGNPGLSVSIAMLMFVVSVCVLQGVVGKVSPKRNDWVSWSVFVLLVPPIAMFLLTEPAVTAFKVAVVLSFLVPLAFQQDHIEKVIGLVYENDGLHGCVKRGVLACLPRRYSVPPGALAADGGVAVSSED